MTMSVVVRKDYKWLNGSFLEKKQRNREKRWYQLTSAKGLCLPESRITR